MNRGVSFSDKPTPRPKTTGGSRSAESNKGHVFTTSRATEGAGRAKFAASTTRSPAAAAPTGDSIAMTSARRSTTGGSSMVNAVTTLRSPSTTSIPSEASSSGGSRVGGPGSGGMQLRSSRSVSPNPKGDAVGGKQSVRRGYLEAKRATDKELQRHLQRLLNQKQQVRRVHDEISKEFSTLTVALELAADACGGFKDSPESGLMEALKKSESSSEQIKQQLIVEGFSEEDVSKQLSYMATLKRHNKLLGDLVIEGGQVLNELSLKDREVQHLASLVDRACDVDLQCMNGTIGDTVVCNGSPMFPHRTIDDTEAVVDEGQGICAKAGRLSLFIRRLVSTGKAEAERSAHDLSLAMSIAARVSARKLSSTRREMEGVQYELGRVQLMAREVDEEFSRLDDRLQHVSKTIGLRETAKDTVFNKGSDFVSVALKREQEELLLRLEELSARRARFTEEEGQLGEDLYRQTLELRDYKTKNAAANRIGASVPTTSHTGSIHGSQCGSRSGSVRMGSSTTCSTPRSGVPSPGMGSNTLRFM